MTKTTGELSDILYLLQRTPSPGGRAIRPCADTVAPRALRPEIGPYRRPDFHADAADRSGPSVAPEEAENTHHNQRDRLLLAPQGIVGRRLHHATLFDQLLQMRRDITLGTRTQPLAQVAGIDVPGDLFDPCKALGQGI